MEPTNDVEQRVAAVEARLENAFALDTRLKSLESDVRKLKSSSVRDWLQTLGPYVSGVIVLVVGFAIRDSVTLAIQREQLDLEYVKQMRDLIKDFDAASTQPLADANAVGLAMYGKFAIIPLVERLEGGDVAPLAAEKGLRLVGSNDPDRACPRFESILRDRGRRFRWQTHKTVIKVIGQSCCPKLVATLDSYRQTLKTAESNAKQLKEFAHRYSEPESFDAESASSLRDELEEALDILKSQEQS